MKNPINISDGCCLADVTRIFSNQGPLHSMSHHLFYSEINNSGHLTFFTHTGRKQYKNHNAPKNEALKSIDELIFFKADNNILLNYYYKKSDIFS